MRATWIGEARIGGRYLNELALEKGYIALRQQNNTRTYQVVKEKELLDLRFDPKAAIIAAAEYDVSELAGISKRLSDSKYARGKLMAFFIGALPDDARAKILYLGHHEGQKGATEFLLGSLTDKGAQYLYESQFLDRNRKRTRIIPEKGAKEVYVRWLSDLVESKITPDKFRQ